MTENSSVNTCVNSAEDAISPRLEANDGANDGAGVRVGEGRSDLDGKGRKPIPWKGVSTLVGCLLTHLTLGAFYTYGDYRMECEDQKVTLRSVSHQRPCKKMTL